MDALEEEPTILSLSSPLLKKSRVGMFLMPYLSGISVLSSTLHLAISHFPSYSVANSSTMGEIIRHGPHHGAQKSNNTGSFDFKTSSSKFESFTAVIIL